MGAGVRTNQSIFRQEARRSRGRFAGTAGQTEVVPGIGVYLAAEDKIAEAVDAKEKLLRMPMR